LFFILSKLLLFLINPLVWILSSFLLAKFLKNAKWKKRSLTIGILLFLFFTNDYLSNRIIHTWEAQTIAVKDIQQPYDVGILLSGYAKSTHFLIDDHHLFQLGDSANRLTQTIELYKLGKIKKILISGGVASILEKTVAESENTKRFLMRLGIPKSDILIESKSRNTYENALYTKAFLQEKNLEKGQRLLLLTSAFHIFRAKKCFEKVGLTVTPFSVDFQTHSLSLHPEYFVPSTLAIDNWRLLIKEWVGILVYKMRGYL